MSVSSEADQSSQCIAAAMKKSMLNMTAARSLDFVWPDVSLHLSADTDTAGVNTASRECEDT